VLTINNKVKYKELHIVARMSVHIPH